MKFFSTRFLAIICSVFGVTVLSSCGDEPEMYGTPSADYEVKGLVTDADGNALDGIHVRIGDNSTEFFQSPALENIYTGKDGKYEAQFSEFPKKKLFVMFTDEKGVYESHGDYVDVKFTDGKGAWYKGKAEVVVNAKLKKIN